ncbi:MAG: hypothetical protein AAB250_14385, partial [Bdellovibrionota bacterium]
MDLFIQIRSSLFYVAFICVAAVLFLSSRSEAACSAPTANIGALDFQSSVFKYCDGTNWLTIGGTPNFPLTGPNGTATGPTYSFSAGTNTGMYSTGAGTLALTTAGAQRLLIDSAGNVGIGTTNPAAGRLHVDAGASAGLGGDVWITNSGTNAVGSKTRVAFGSDATTDTTPNAGIENVITGVSPNLYTDPDSLFAPQIRTLCAELRA